VKLLALDTATESCSAALLMDGQLLTREEEFARGHAERILPMIDELLSEAQLSLRQLDAIAFGRGPGSFTGVRLGVTVTQGLAFGSGLGVVPISDLQAVAQRALQMDPAANRILVCNDARMSEVYWGCYERTSDGLAQALGEEHVSKPSQLELPPAWPTATGVGRGFVAYGEALRMALPTVRADNPFLTQLLPRAAEIALLAAPAVTAGRILPPEAAIPIYLRDNVAHVAQPTKPAG
jgi:tRNA threonylcarbamoyladenosine biosynthesis protein TsaB